MGSKNKRSLGTIGVGTGRLSRRRAPLPRGWGEESIMNLILIIVESRSWEKKSF